MSALRAGRYPLAVVLLTSLLVSAAHFANLAYLGRVTETHLPDEPADAITTPFGTRDSTRYLGLARVMAEDGFPAVDVLRKPPGLPFLLYASETLTGSAMGFLWSIPLWIGLSAAVAARFAWELSGSRAAALLCALAFGSWPATYQYAPLLLTDTLHACLLVLVTYASYRWFLGNRVRWGVVAAFLWPALLWLRSTLFFVPYLMTGFVIASLARRRKVHGVTWLILVTTVSVPAYLATRNAQMHGLAIVSALGVENLACYAGARTRAEMGRGDFKELRADCFETYRQLDTATERYEAQKRDVLALARAHPYPTLRSFWKEIVDQTSHPVSPYHKAELRSHYPRVFRVDREGMWAFWFLSLLGLGVIGRRHPVVAAWFLVCFVGIIGTASIATLAGARLRLPLDFLFFPVVAVGLAWLGSAITRPLGKPRS